MTAVDPAADRLAAGVAATGRRIEAAATAVGSAVDRDWPATLDARARLRGLAPAGRATASGAGRLLAGADGWVAVQLPRPDDLDLLAAWSVLADPGRADDPEVDPTDPWPAVADVVARCPTESLVGAAALVGLAVAGLGERRPDPTGGAVVHHRRPRPRRGPLRVVDLSALWAGPLCGAILADAGAEVTKVASTTRPDGAEAGDPALFALLNGAKARRTVDVTTGAGRAELAELVRGADVVIESTRPRALEQLGIVAADLLAEPDGPVAWVSITGHGRGSPRIAYGDDAAVAGGLVDHRLDGPRFLGDALADPLSGLAAAATVLELLAAGDGGLVEVAMAAVAAAHAEPEGRR